MYGVTVEEAAPFLAWSRLAAGCPNVIPPSARMVCPKLLVQNNVNKNNNRILQTDFVLVANVRNGYNCVMYVLFL
ncbi:MAG: hypothetical protein C4329_10765 [Chitinophagaceae bacterium]